MVLLHSEKSKLGISAPAFSLKSVDGKNYTLSDFQSKKVLVMMFICNHCPYVKAIEDRIIALQRKFETQSVQLVGICSNDWKDYPEDSPAHLLSRWKEKDYRFPYLMDEPQAVAKACGAVCTPDIFVFDASRKLVYHGRLDDNWQDASRVTRRDLEDGISALLEGQPVKFEQFPSMGCSIKWKH